jgi:hypothetical protein
LNLSLVSCVADPRRAAASPAMTMMMRGVLMMRGPLPRVGLLFVAAMLLGAPTGSSAAPTYVVDVRSSPEDSVRLPVLVCAGLFNRRPAHENVRAYVLKDATDEAWLSRTEGINASSLPKTTPAAFVAKCMQVWRWPA